MPRARSSAKNNSTANLARQAPAAVTRNAAEGEAGLSNAKQRPGFQFHQFVTPETGRKFTELYNVQHLTSNHLDPVARLTICSTQRLYAMLRSLVFFLNKRRPQGQFTRGDRPRFVRVQRTVSN